MVLEAFRGEAFGREVLLAQIRHLVRTGTLDHDTTFILFGEYPTPEELQSFSRHQDSVNVTYKRAVAVKTFQLCNRGDHDPSLDPAYGYLFETIAKDLDVQQPEFDQEIESILTRLALSTVAHPERTPVDPRKDRILEYYRWIARGRKDDGFQFLTHKLRALGPQPPANGSAEVHCSAVMSSSLADLKNCQMTDELCCPGLLQGGYPSLFCGGCAIRNPGGGNVIGMRYYCGPLCFARDSLNHAEECKEMYMFCRMTEAFTELFKHFQARDCSANIASVVETNDIITVQEKGLYHCPSLQLPILQQYPRTASSPTSSEQWGMVEAELASADWTHEAQMLLQLFFHPMANRIRKMIFQPKNAHKSVQRILPNGKHIFNTLQKHEILCITLPSGHELAFDPTGARYGWKEVLSPLTSFVAQRVHFSYYEVDIEPWSAETYGKQDREREYTPGCGLRKVYYARMADYYVRSQHEWLCGQDPQRTWLVRDMFTLPRDKFVELLDFSVDKVKQCMDSEVEQALLAARVSECLDEADPHEKVRLAKAAYDALEHDLDQMLQEAMARQNYLRHFGKTSTKLKGNERTEEGRKVGK